MNNRHKALIVALMAPLCAAVTCDRPPPNNDPVLHDAGPPDALSDAGEHEEDSQSPVGSLCERACSKMEELGCPGWEGGEQGSCVQVCENHEKSGVGSFCPEDLSRMRGRRSADGGLECDEAELEAAFEACL